MCCAVPHVLPRRCCDEAGRGLLSCHASWWPEWQKWIADFGGGKVPARNPGDGKLKVIEDAPGSFVKVRAHD